MLDGENNNEEKLEVNLMARRKRHEKIFDAKERVKVKFKAVKRSFWGLMSRALEIPGVSTVKKIANTAQQFSDKIMPYSPKRRLIFNAAIVSIVMMVVSMVNPTGYSVSYANYDENYIDAYYLPGEVLVSDDYGFVVKINPQTEQSSRIGLTDFAIHKVESGETLSVIAEKYGISGQTIQWENNLANPNSLRIGQQLYIPPVDGVSYVVASGDNLEKIAKDYKIEVDSIVAQNALDEPVIHKGQKLFLPGAERKAPIVAARSGGGGRVGVGSSSAYVNASASSAVPAGDRPFIFPTRGLITWGYRSGHYALDIADRSKPPIWAAGAGTVVKASSGTYGGGYGNHIVIDHGDGLKTLYAHMDSLNVSVGQAVNQGDVIGIMGNTGRVFGATGIHLHWEVMQNGVKQFPGNYY